MTLRDLPLKELLTRAAGEVDREKFKDVIEEISQRYKQQDRHMVFDIYAGIDDSDANAVWLEPVVGLHAAMERMQKIAATSPGSHFLFHSQSRRIMARLSNGPIKAAEMQKSAKTGTES